MLRVVRRHVSGIQLHPRLLAVSNAAGGRSHAAVTCYGKRFCGLAALFHAGFALGTLYTAIHSNADRCSSQHCPLRSSQATFDLAQRSLPRSSLLFLCRTVMRSVAASIVRLFQPGGGIRAFNGHAIVRLAADIAALQVNKHQLAIAGRNDVVERTIDRCNYFIDVHST